ncbi:hypothetical protein AMELA_G00064650 [Ameiurus melas]|uniref:Uncharacterized protein n=1 Tax=Ameiurus melas TaxID=219545 RepID=A0A7J6B2Q7_AMEME|nr:hypothetical protein AMELA_G00064650 [Ameiurus melas]
MFLQTFTGLVSNGASNRTQHAQFTRSHVCADVICTIIFYCVNTNLSRAFHMPDTCVLIVNVWLCECVSLDVSKLEFTTSLMFQFCVLFLFLVGFFFFFPVNTIS